MSEKRRPKERSGDVQEGTDYCTSGSGQRGTTQETEETWMERIKRWQEEDENLSTMKNAGTKDRHGRTSPWDPGTSRICGPGGTTLERRMDVGGF